jgi:hypothetical protein
MLDAADGGRLVFRHRPGRRPPGGKAAGEKRSRREFESLMLEPGDGLVTRSSQTARRPLELAPATRASTMLPIRAASSCANRHGRLTHNLYFQDNLLYFLLSR